jgi:hypothetical protein
LLGQGISPTDITADGGEISSSTTHNSNSLIDHEGKQIMVGPITAQYKSNGNYTINSYAITTSMGKAPSIWKLEGSNNGMTWKVIDEQNGIEFPYPGSTYVCSLKSAPTYQYYQLKIEEKGVEVTQWQLYGKYDYGTCYADITSFSIVTKNDDKESIELVDNNGETCSTIEGNSLLWNIVAPIPVKVVGFSLVCGDNPDYDPTNITLLGVDDSGITTPIATRSIAFNARAGRVTATATTSQVYRSFQLVVNETASGGNIARLAEFELFGSAISDDNYANIVLFPNSVETSAAGLSTTETVDKLFDKNRSTRYRTNFTESVSVTCSFETSVEIDCYTITAAKDVPANDPKEWILEGSNDNTEWIIVDSRAEEFFSNRYTTQAYKLAKTAKYNKYRLTIKDVNGGTQLHIGELQFLNLKEWYLNDDTYTSIKHFKEKTITKDNCVYDLIGRKINYQPKRGIYIIGGKKVFIK